jgi:hypothetical protein
LEDSQRKTINALLVMVLTPHIREHLRQRDPKALEQAITALRDTLPESEWERFEERLAQAKSEASKTKLLVARFKVFLPKPHWACSSIDDGKTGEVLFEGPGIPYLSRS